MEMIEQSIQNFCRFFFGKSKLKKKKLGGKKKGELKKKKKRTLFDVRERD